MTALWCHVAVYVQMEENQGCQPAEPGLKEVFERLNSLLQGWSRPEKQVHARSASH